MLNAPTSRVFKVPSTVWSLLPSAVGLIVWFIAAWQLGPERLPSPLSTASLLVSSLFENPIIATQGGGSGGYSPHIVATLLHVLMGVIAGSIAGLVISLVCAENAFLRAMLNTAVEMGRALPPLLFIPFAAIVYGPSRDVEIIGVGLYSFVIFALYSINALGNVPEYYVDLATLLGAGRFRRMWTVQLPAIMPSLIGATRVVFSFGIGIAIVAEYLVSPSGIGRVMKYSVAYSNASLIVVGVIWTVCISFLCDALTVAFFSMFLKWTRRQELLQWMVAERGSRPI